MISPAMVSYDSVSPTPLTAPFAADEEEAFWSLFDGVGGVPSNDYMVKYEPMSGSSSRADGSSMRDDMSSSSSSSNSAVRPRTIESFLAAYATPAPSTVGAPATPQITPTLPSVAMFGNTPFTPAATGVLFSASPEEGMDGEPADPHRRELKRQRNTEASARFRLRKKQRENQLESHAKHLEDEVVALRAEKSALERQVKVLLEVLGNVGRERRADAEGNIVSAPTPPQ